VIDDAIFLFAHAEPGRCFEKLGELQIASRDIGEFVLVIFKRFKGPHRVQTLARV
jgi:hypothetical protein